MKIRKMIFFVLLVFCVFYQSSAMTDLHVVAGQGNPDIIHTLLAEMQEDERIAFVNATVEDPENQYYGMTALHIAAYTGHASVISALIFAGADFNATVNNVGGKYHGMTALHIVVHFNYINVIHNCEQQTGIVNTTKQDSNIATDEDDIMDEWRRRTEKGFDVLKKSLGRMMGGFKNRFLMDKSREFFAGDVAVIGNHVNAINTLINTVPSEQRAAFVNVAINNPEREYNGYTVLHFAVFCRDADIIRVLIANGAQVPASLAPQLQELGITEVPLNQFLY